MPLTEDSPLREKLYPYRGEGKDRSFDEYDKIPVEHAYVNHPEIAGTVVRLPAVYGEGDYQYRIKSAREQHERVAKESELDRV